MKTRRSVEIKKNSFNYSKTKQKRSNTGYKSPNRSHNLNKAWKIQLEPRLNRLPPPISRPAIKKINFSSQMKNKKRRM